MTPGALLLDKTSTSSVVVARMIATLLVAAIIAAPPPVCLYPSPLTPAQNHSSFLAPLLVNATCSAGSSFPLAGPARS